MYTSKVLVFSRFLFLGVLLISALGFNSDASSQSLPTGTFKAAESYSFNHLVCARAKKNRGSFIPGKMISIGSPRKRYFQSYSSILRSLLVQQRHSSGATKRKLTRQIANVRSLLVNSWVCTTGHIPELVALNSSFSGSGLSPVAISFNVQGVSAASAVQYDIVSQTGSASIVQYPNGTALVTPADNRTLSFSVTYKASQTFGTTVITSNLAAVTVNWDQSKEFGGSADSLAHYKDSLSEKEARYLGRWVGLGKDSDTFVAKATAPGGLDAVVQQLTTPSSDNCAAVEAEAERLAAMDKSSRFATVTVNDNGTNRYPVFTSAASDSANAVWTQASINTYVLYNLRYGCNPLQERMALFWSNHFAVNLGNFVNSNDRSNYAKRHIDLLRSKLFPGSGLLTPFSTIISKMHGEDGAMLLTLNNNDNYYAGFGNENYARELQELFTLGLYDVGTGERNYTEEDVYALSFGVMGWTEGTSTPQAVTMTCNPTYDSLNAPTNDCARLSNASLRTQTVMVTTSAPKFDASRWNHPTRPTKQLLYANKPWAIYDALKSDTTSGADTVTPYLLYSHPGVARYIAARLLATFATPEPTNDMIGLVADSLRSNQYQLEPALRMILSSSAFFAGDSQKGVSAPIESYISFIRLFNLPLKRSEPGASPSFNLLNDLSNAVTYSGQPIYNHPSIFGYKELGKITGGVVHRGDAWIANQLFLERSRGFINYLNQVNNYKAALGFSWKQVLPTGDPTIYQNPSSIMNAMVTKLGITVSDQEKSIILKYLTTAVTRVQTVNLNTIPDPAYSRTIKWSSLTSAQLDTVLDQKIPGLLSILWELKRTQSR